MAQAIRVPGSMTPMPPSPRRPFYTEEFNLKLVFKPNSIFVMMPFDGDKFQDEYFAIKDECTRLNLIAARVDERLGSSLIIKEIAQMIGEAEFIICDLTSERPNVYYELGYAHGSGNDAEHILLLAREGTKLHFDISPLRVNYYRSTEHLRSIVAYSLKGMIEKTRTLPSA
jgi:hypothetical protein